MGLTRRFLETRMPIVGPDYTISQNPADRFLLFDQNNTVSGATTNEYTAEGLDTAYACVRVLSDSIAQVPLKLFRRTPTGRQPDTSHPLYSILHDLPNPEMTSFDLRATLARWLFLWGDSYAEIRRNPSGTVRSIWPLRSDSMTVDRNASNTLRYRYRLENGREQVWTFDANNPPIWHWRINSLDGIHGRSPIRVARETFGAAQAARDYGARFFGGGGQPSGILTVPGPLTDKLATDIRSLWKANRSVLENGHVPAVIGSGTKYQPITTPPEDAQFIETQRFGVEAVCRIYGVPPFMVGATERSTSWGTGIEEQKIGFVSFTLTPHYEQIQQAAKRDLLTYKSFETHDPLFVLNALLRGDMSRRFEAYLKGHNRWLTTNEIRELEDMNRVEGGDEMGTPAGTAVDRTPAAVTEGD